MITSFQLFLIWSAKKMSGMKINLNVLNSSTNFKIKNFKENSVFPKTQGYLYFSNVIIYFSLDNVKMNSTTMLLSQISK